MVSTPARIVEGRAISPHRRTSMLKTALTRVALAALVAVLGVTALAVLVFWVLVLGKIMA